MKKHILPLLLILLPFTYNLGQITITESDFTNLFTIGNTITDFTDTNTAQINIGEPGGNNTWDFQHIIADTFFTFTFIDASTTPFKDTFPGANVATYLSFELTISNDATMSSESWNYYSNTQYLEYGTAGYVTNTISNVSQTYNNIETHIPPFSEYIFPMVFGDPVRSYTDSTMFQSLQDGELVYGDSNSFVYNSLIDAWGTMIMPGGKTVDALRERRQTIKTSYLIPGFPQSSVEVHYIFSAKSGESFSILADSENPSTSGTISGLVAWNNDEVTSVEKLNNLPKIFRLSQNYPNPFNPSTIIEYSITKPSHVKLKIFDVLGNEVSELVNRTQARGIYEYNFNASHLSSGIYFYQLTTGAGVITKKMEILK